MEKSSPINQAILQLKELQQSEVYQYHCRLFSEKCVQLSEIAQQMIRQEESLHLACQEHTVQEELAVQCCSLHRGFYCPSPVYDLIVGNTHRGRILKKPNKKVSLLISMVLTARGSYYGVRTMNKDAANILYMRMTKSLAYLLTRMPLSRPSVKKPIGKES